MLAATLIWSGTDFTAEAQAAVSTKLAITPAIVAWRRPRPQRTLRVRADCQRERSLISDRRSGRTPSQLVSWIHASRISSVSRIHSGSRVQAVISAKSGS